MKVTGTIIVNAKACCQSVSRTSQSYPAPLDIQGQIKNWDIFWKTIFDSHENRIPLLKPAPLCLCLSSAGSISIKNRLLFLFSFLSVYIWQREGEKESDTYSIVASGEEEEEEEGFEQNRCWWPRAKSKRIFLFEQSFNNSGLPRRVCSY